VLISLAAFVAKPARTAFTRPSQASAPQPIKLNDRFSIRRVEVEAVRKPDFYASFRKVQEAFSAACPLSQAERQTWFLYPRSQI
jgi:hypothetical protein